MDHVGLAFYARLAKHPVLFRAAARVGRLLLALTARDGWVRSMPGPLAGWTAHRDFPLPAAKSFQDLWRERRRRRVVSGRATVLGHIAANLRRGGGAVHGVVHPAEAGAHAGAGSPAVAIPQDLLVERFGAELTAIAGRVHRAADRTRGYYRSHGRVP